MGKRDDSPARRPETCILEDGGAEGIRTPDPHNAIVVLYQLSYDPIQSGETLRTAGGFVKANCRAKGFYANWNEFAEDKGKTIQPRIHTDKH